MELTKEQLKKFENRKEEMKDESKAIGLGMSLEEYKEYKLYWLENPQRIKEVWSILEKLIVGEQENKKVLFYNALSCLLEQPNGTIILSEASAGKTHLVREILKLFPKSMKIIFGGASKKALIHMKGNVIKTDDGGIAKVIDFKGKILWFLEDTGGEESYKILRPILSRDQEEIRFELPTKKRGKKGSEFFANDVIIIKGSPAYITTTTRQERLPEMGTRVFLLSMDETRKQTENIVNFKINKRRFIKPGMDLKSAETFIGSLKPYNVWIPFADIVKINSDALNLRRDIDKIFALIETNALFNQIDRPIVNLYGKEYLVATLEDYFEIMNVITPILKPTLLNMPKKILDFHDVLKELDSKGVFDNEEPIKDREGKVIDSKIIKEITHKKIAELTGLSQETSRNYCWELEKAGWVWSEKRGGTKFYTLKSSHNQEKQDKDVTPLLIDMVTPNLMLSSLKELKSYLTEAVTESIIINYIEVPLQDLLYYVYMPLVTGNENSDFAFSASLEAEIRRFWSESNGSNETKEK